MSTAEEFKAKGNAALQSGKTSEAIEHYTSAINLDGSNHVYYSNRSAAYLKKGDAVNALEDAEACIGLNPSFTKGYSRKGAALHALKRYNDSIAAYESGLEKFPGDQALKNGLESVKKEKDGPSYGGGMSGGMGGGFPGAPGGGLFGPEMMARLAMNPKTRPYLNDEDFMKKIKMIQSDPNALTTMLGDPKIMEAFQVMLGGNVEIKTPDEMKEDMAATKEMKKEAPKKEESKPEPMEEEEDLSDLTPEELEIRENKKKSIKAKENGNALYKSKKFKEALAAYDEAIELDPTSMTFHSNKAAVYLTMKSYDDCIACCLKAVEVGKANMAPYEDRAKAYTRCAKAYQKKKDLDKAIEMCNEAQLECYDKATERMMKTMELERRKAAVLAYQDDEKAEEAKQRGNDHFRAKEWAKAVEAYEEAVKRAPKNAPIRNNLAAALCKIMDFNGAKMHIEEAVHIDPKYTKAWARKGDIEMVMKENHKALDSYKAGLAIDPDNAACKEGLRKCTAQINYGAATMTEEEKQERAQHGLADPEIQAIIQDPVVQQVLRDFNENPNAANQAMNNPSMRAKIEKLIAAGVLQTA
mmetsp:Transcript_2543/g.4011  ORF Transcript_2543/g.4011 Transcript_2543/m.4011 type:complete len:583 (+) Transcript_2543:130-1878(+)